MKKTVIYLCLSVLWIMGCQSTKNPIETATVEKTTTAQYLPVVNNDIVDVGMVEPIVQPTTPLPTAESPTFFGRTDHQLDGNRIVTGTTNLPDTNPIDIPLGGQPEWITSAPYKEGTIWVATLNTGAIEAYYLLDGVVTDVPIEPNSLPAGSPSLLRVKGDNAQIVTPSAP